jgi:hypothetical protein
LVEHAGGSPLGEPAPAGRRRAAAKLWCRQQPPRGGGAGQVHDRGEAVAVGDGTVPAAVRWAWWGRQQGRDQRPQLVRHEVISQGCHGARSCQTVPKGAKRRLKLLIFPIVTACAYLLAYAYELGSFDSLGIPTTLLTVELGQLAIPGLLGVGAALIIGFSYRLYLDMREQEEGSLIAEVFLWLPFFVLAELLWPEWGTGVLLIFFLGRQAGKSRPQARLWQVATVIWIWLVLRRVVPRELEVTVHFGAAMFLFSIVYSVVGLIGGHWFSIRREEHPVDW